jgi:hypothetical protein
MSLNPRQFDLYADHDTEGDPSGYAYSMYRLGRESRQIPDEVDVHGTIEVVHHPTAPYRRQGWNEESYGSALHQPDDQQVLFGEQYTTKFPGRSEVVGMDVTKEARSMAVPMLAVAARDTALRYGGRQLTPSGDRSPHSERLVQGMASKGLIEGHKRTYSNNMGFSQAAPFAYHELGDYQAPGRLQQAKRDVREMIRQAPGRKRRTDGVQQELFS